jgi:hypothetical protein
MAGTYHVVPVDDLLEHEEIGDFCVCGPHVEYFSGARVIVHHALDGRNAHDVDWPRRRAHEVASDHMLS